MPGGTGCGRPFAVMAKPEGRVAAAATFSPGAPTLLFHRASGWQAAPAHHLLSLRQPQELPQRSSAFPADRETLPPSPLCVSQRYSTPLGAPKLGARRREPQRCLMATLIPFLEVLDIIANNARSPTFRSAAKPTSDGLWALPVDHWVMQVIELSRFAGETDAEVLVRLMGVQFCLHYAGHWKHPRRRTTLLAVGSPCGLLVTRNPARRLPCTLPRAGWAAPAPQDRSAAGNNPWTTITPRPLQEPHSDTTPQGRSAH